MAAPINDWLAQTVEPTLEPELPICDPHHHFWDQRPDRVEPRYMLDQLMADTGSGHNIVSTVFVEARSMYRDGASDEMRPVGEVEFVQGIAAQSASGIYGSTRAAHGIVGHANLHLGSNVRPVLEALRAASPNRFSGIRHGVGWDPHPEIASPGAYPFPNQLASEDYRAGARALAEMNLSLDVSCLHPQLPEVADFARGRSRPDHRAEPCGRADPYGAVCRQSGRNDGQLARRYRGGSLGSQRGAQAGRRRDGSHGVRLASTLDTGWLRRGGDINRSDHALLHRTVRAEPLHVREQLPGGQGIVLVSRDVERLQADVGGLFGQRAGGYVPRLRGAGVSVGVMGSALTLALSREGEGNEAKEYN